MDRLARLSPERNVLFDLDGTLINSQPGIHNSLRHAFQELGYQLPEDLNWVLGPPLETVVKKLLEPFDDTRVAIAVAYYRSHYESLGLYQAEPYDGVHQLLEELTSRGYNLAVATSKLSPFAHKVVEHFSLMRYFQEIVGTEPAGPPSSKAKLIASLMDRHGFQTGATIMVGDRYHDVIAARENRLEAIGVLYGYGSREELMAAGASCLCDSPSHLSALL